MLFITENHQGPFCANCQYFRAHYYCHLGSFSPCITATASAANEAANGKNTASVPSGNHPTERTTNQLPPVLTFPTAPFPKPRLDISHRKC